jgi:hypothetical protein
MSAAYRAKVRMYRQGLGDCWLIALPRAAPSAAPFYIMIDCGAIDATPDAVKTMQAIVEDIKATTGGRIDLLVATHKHWDHLSGFIQASEQFTGITFDAVWLGWTENPADAQAQRLGNAHAAALRSLAVSENQLRLAGATDSADEIGGLLDFFGAGGNTTASALDAVRALSKNVTYHEPKETPYELEGTGVRIYVLGPPRDETRLGQLLLPAGSSELYGIAATADAGGPATDDGGAPFDAMQLIPLDVARALPFFMRRYWGSDVAPAVDAADWRRIDAAWMESQTELALQLDSVTNNTSLVLAIELANGDVLLFPGDAQVGNWLSWKDLSWEIGGKTVQGPDLLARCVFYKVGHHGSHNATLRADGLELMGQLQTAMIPVRKDVAMKKGWDQMPLQALLDALAVKARVQVIRADEALPAGSSATGPASGDLYYEVTLA